jgi:hypothetical protein
MPTASASQSRSRRASTARAKPTRGAATTGKGVARAAAVRWDRVGRAAMLCVLCALVYLYASAGVHMFSTWRQAHHDRAAVASMEHEHRQLVRQHTTLSRQESLESEARQLGLMKRGEQPYVVSGLPNN